MEKSWNLIKLLNKNRKIGNRKQTTKPINDLQKTINISNSSNNNSKPLFDSCSQPLFFLLLFFPSLAFNSSSLSFAFFFFFVLLFLLFSHRSSLSVQISMNLLKAKKCSIKHFIIVDLLLRLTSSIQFTD